MSGHTPGPWEIGKLATPDWAPQYAIYAGPGPSVAVVVHGNSEANAKLITAAPELLASLIEVMNHFAPDQGLLAPEVEVISRARDAIAKATGEAQC